MTDKQIPHELAWHQTQASTVTGKQRTTLVMPLALLTETANFIMM
jgi:hypothetical protein